MQLREGVNWENGQTPNFFQTSGNEFFLKNVLSNYPLYKEKYTDEDGVEHDRRKEFNSAFFQKYYFREIGVESWEMFCFLVNQRLTEIMPIINQRLKTEDIDFNPLYNIELHESYDFVSEGNSESTGTSENASSSSNSENSNSVNTQNDTPPDSITEDEMKSSKYLSSFNTTRDENNGNSESNSSSSSTGTSKDKNKQSYTKTTQGSSAGLPFSKAIQQWRDIQINIKKEFVDSFKDLFMNIY